MADEKNACPLPETAVKARMSDEDWWEKKCQECGSAIDEGLVYTHPGDFNRLTGGPMKWYICSNENCGVSAPIWWGISWCGRLRRMWLAHGKRSNTISLPVRRLASSSMISVHNPSSVLARAMVFGSMNAGVTVAPRGSPNRRFFCLSPEGRVFFGRFAKGRPETKGRLRQMTQERPTVGRTGTPPPSRCWISGLAVAT